MRGWCCTRAARSAALLLPAVRRVESQIVEAAVAQAINPRVDLERLAPRPRVLTDGRLADVTRLVADVQLAEPTGARAALQPLEIAGVHPRHVLHVPQPVVDEPELGAVDRRIHSAAA